jgi:hypothetical protein
MFTFTCIAEPKDLGVLWDVVGALCLASCPDFWDVMWLIKSIAKYETLFGRCDI